MSIFMGIKYKCANVYSMLNYCTQIIEMGCCTLCYPIKKRDFLLTTTQHKTHQNVLYS